MRADGKQMLEEEARAVFESAFDRKPRKSDWGFYSYGDGPAAAGGGVGGFWWFAARREMIDAVAKHHVYFSSGPVTKEPAVVAREVAVAIKAMGSSASGREAARNRVNRALKGFAQITWWGTFASLLDGQGAFEKGLRASFRGEAEEDDERGEDHARGKARPADRPIAAREMAAFREYLRTHGL